MFRRGILGMEFFILWQRPFFGFGIQWGLATTWNLCGHWSHVFDPGKDVNRVCVVGGRSDEQAPREPTKHFPLI